MLTSDLLYARLARSYLIRLRRQSRSSSSSAYIAGLAAVHDDLRTELAVHTQRWDAEIEACGSDFLAAGARSLTGLALVRVTGERTYDLVVHVSPGPVTRRRALEGKNSHLKYYEQVLVASRPTA
jgi:hypothetical protein